MSSMSVDQISIEDDRLLNLLNSLPSMALVLDDELRVKFANKTFCDFIDRSLEEIIGNDFLSILPATNENHISHLSENLPPDNESSTEVIELSNSDSKTVSVEWTFELESDNSDGSEQYYLFGRQISPPTISVHEPDDELELNDEVFRKMADSIQEGFWLMDYSWSEVLYANSTCESIYGVPYERLLKDVENWTENIVPEDLDQMYRHLAPENIRDMKHPREIQFRLDHPEKGRRLINLEISPIPQHGQTKKLVGLASDITEHEELLQDQLEEQQHFLESIINTAPQGIFVKTAQGEYILANETVSEVFGVPRNQIEGKTDFDLLDDEVAEKFYRDDQEVLKKGKPIQYEDQVPHAGLGDTRTFLTVKTLLFENRPREDQLILGITTDISKRKSLQEKLEKQKEYLQTIINSAPNLIFVKDWNGVFQIANEALASFYDTTREELIGKTDADFNPNEEEVESFLEADREVMRFGKSKEIAEEPVTNLRTGETHWFQTIKVPLFTDEPIEDRQVLGVSTEITEKKKIRENLEESLREKETLLGEIHHRVKNNLQIIQSLIRMELRERDDDNPALRDCINRINSMALLHEKLYQSDSLDEIDLSSYLEDLCEHLRQAVGKDTENIKISPTVQIDSIQIQEAVSCGLIVNELVTNSLQHGFEDGEVGEIHISFRSDDHEHELIVKDDGHGLPDDVNITDVESTGIRIIRSIVEYEFQGEIDFEENNGLVVNVSFPSESLSD